ncbi:hypothetical protein RhiirA5_433921 [Rhizophagus irregularis]|uniref:Uncharacterized protein n=1 Tax=Rhizophagus irregularis TaxID=588596 RepID=A0A2N0NQX7_9GLOM|nr:hypothetical protein RhiirA5_433921 [Rhizophagus irregularis]
MIDLHKKNSHSLKRNIRPRVHQQQIDGLFNKYDLKCHPNMTNETKQAKLQLAFENIFLTTSNLHEERKRKKKEWRILIKIIA